MADDLVDRLVGVLRLGRRGSGCVVPTVAATALGAAGGSAALVDGERAAGVDVGHGVHVLVDRLLVHQRKVLGDQRQALQQRLRVDVVEPVVFERPFEVAVVVVAEPAVGQPLDEEVVQRAVDLLDTHLSTPVFDRNYVVASDPLSRTVTTVGAHRSRRVGDVPPPCCARSGSTPGGG